MMRAALVLAFVIVVLPVTAAQQSVTKYVRYVSGAETSYGILDGDTILQLDGDPFSAPRRTGRRVSLAEVRLIAPVEPSKVIAVGLNYRSHLGNREPAAYPGLFAKYPSSIIGPDENIVIPADAGNVHYEGELVVVIGRRAKNVSEADAPSYVFGVTAGNDVSERDWQGADLQWFRAKASDTFGPIGPAVVTGLDYGDLLLQTRLNGEVVQSQRTSDLLFDVPAIVSYVSRYVTLEPGDLIFTGTPGTTRAFGPGDVVEVEIEGVGTLRNPAVSAAAAQKPDRYLAAGDHERTLTVGGRERSYTLHVPARAVGRTAPVVLALHGGAGNARSMIRLAGFDALADHEGFLVVYPNGTGRLPRFLTWNAGACCGYAVEQGIDDVGFVRAVLDDVARVARVDRSRVYATGISNGGQMAYRLAAELPDRIAAIAPVAASLEVAVDPKGRPVGVAHFHGTADEHVPLEGGVGRRSIVAVAFKPVSHAIETWATRNGCDAEPRIQHFRDRYDDGTRVERRVYRNCREGGAVELFIVHGGGHTWPGEPVLERLLGATTREIFATDLMWAFFERHRR